MEGMLEGVKMLGVSGTSSEEMSESIKLESSSSLEKIDDELSLRSFPILTQLLFIFFLIVSS
jgi:hypothetical protein